MIGDRSSVVNEVFQSSASTCSDELGEHQGAGQDGEQHRGRARRLDERVEQACAHVSARRVKAKHSAPKHPYPPLRWR